MDDAIVAGLVAIGAIAGAVILVSMLGPSIWDRGEQTLESDVRSADVIGTSMKIIDAESVDYSKAFFLLLPANPLTQRKWKVLIRS